jgi:predicted Zn-dependent protease
LPREFKIYFCERIPDEVAEHVEHFLSDIFKLQFRSVGVRIPRQVAWNSEKNAFDARRLLETAKSEGLSFFLWLVEKSLVVNGDYVYGYAETIKGTIVSTSRMATRTLVAKEVAFHVGRALGLQPCREECLMRETKSFEILIQKPSNLCNTCNAKFQRLKMRYI